MNDSEPNDSELLRELTAADPVDIDTVPGPESAPAQLLLETTMRSDAGPAAVTGQTIQNDPVVKQMKPRRTSFMRSRATLASAAAAVLLLVGGLLVFSPDNTPSAVAAVHSAAAAADSDSGRISTTFGFVGSHDEDGEVSNELHSGRFDAEFSGSDIAFSFQADESVSDSGFDAGDLPISEGRLVDDVLYFHDGSVWRSIDTDGMLGSLVSDFVDPRVVLEKVQELTEAVEVGQTTIDGQDVTHYQSVVDLGDESLSQSGWLGFEAGSFDGEGEVTVDMYVADNDILARLDLSGDVQEGADSGTFEVSMRFTDIGSDITVEAPADVVELNLLDGLLDE